MQSTPTQPMVMLRLTMLAGRSPEQKVALHAALAQAAAEHLGVPLEIVRMVIVEVPTEHWSAGGVAFGAPPTPTIGDPL